MATRSQARDAVVALLYAYDAGNDRVLDFATDFLEERKIRHKQRDFALNLLRGILEHLSFLDSEIRKYLKDWDFSRLGGIERAVLRLGSYELFFTSTHSPIIINEAVELTKNYVEHPAPSFINGILDSMGCHRRDGLDSSLLGSNL